MFWKIRLGNREAETAGKGLRFFDVLRSAKPFLEPRFESWLGAFGCYRSLALRLFLLRFRAGLLRALEFPSTLNVLVVPNTGIYSSVHQPPGLGDLPRQKPAD